MKPSIMTHNLDSYHNNDNSNNSEVEAPYKNSNFNTNTYKQKYSVHYTKTTLRTVKVIAISVAAIMLTLLII